MGGSVKAMYLRMASSAVLPWLSPEAGGKRGPHRSSGLNHFISGDGYHTGMATAEEVEQCLNCPYPECRDCQKRQRGNRRKKAQGELAEHLMLRKCERIET